MKNLFHFRNSSTPLFVYQQPERTSEIQTETTQKKIEKPFPDFDFPVNATSRSLVALEDHQVMFYGKSLLICGRKIANFSRDTDSFEVYLDPTTKNKGAIIIMCKNKSGSKQEIMINNGILSVDGKPCAKLSTPIKVIMPVPNSLKMQSIPSSLVLPFKEFAKQGYVLKGSDIITDIISPNGQNIGQVKNINFEWAQDVFAIMEKHSAQ